MDKDTTSYFAKYYTLYASYIAKINLMEMGYYKFDDGVKEMQVIGNDIMNEMQKDFGIKHREKSLVDSQDTNDKQQIDPKSIQLQYLIHKRKDKSVLDKYIHLRGTNLFVYLSEVHMSALMFDAVNKSKEDLIDHFIYAMDKVKLEMGLL